MHSEKALFSVKEVKIATKQRNELTVGIITFYCDLPLVIV